MKKSVLSILLATMMILCLTSVAFAEPTNENNGPYTYEFPDGTAVEYYLDELLHPYNVINGSKTLLIIPLEHLKVKDPALLAQIHKDLPSSPEELINGITTYAVPTSYTDLSGSTRSYSKSVTFKNEEIFNTPIFKFTKTHRTLYFTPSNVKKPIFSSGHLNIIYTYYDPYFDRWESLMFTDVAKAKFQHTPDMFEFGKFTFNQFEDISSLTYTVHSTNP